MHAKVVIGKKKEKSCDVHVHVRVKVVDFGRNDGDGDDELAASITYLTLPTLPLHAPVEWQDGRVQR